MKCYKLLKDLPTFKAGEKFFISESGNLIAGTPSNPKQITVETIYGIPKKIELMAYAQETLEEFPNILTDWLEETAEPKWAYHINDHGDSISCIRVGSLPSSERYLKEIGNYFETKEEAEKYLEYLKAKAVIKKDIGGFKPDWEDMGELKYYGYWDCNVDEVDLGYTYGDKQSDIYFKSEKDIKESFKKHPEEWKVYLFHEL